MKPEDVVELYSLLAERGVHLWIDGGWGIDALLEEQTRPHKDLDLLVRIDDLATMTQALAPLGFALKDIWEENRWAGYPTPVPLIVRESAGIEVATAFVLKDVLGRELDFHVLAFDEHGNGVPIWNSDVLFPADAFTGRGTIAGTTVSCLSARMQMLTHTGYVLQDKDVRDLQLLHERFGVDYSPEHAGLFSPCH
jgi:lincosamide nucleotidyltransferase A/C/D/E